MHCQRKSARTSTAATIAGTIVGGGVDRSQGPCRERTVEGNMGGRSEKVDGTACRQSDGSWRVVN